MSNNQEHTFSDDAEVVTIETGQGLSTQGYRIENFIATKHLVPSSDWIIMNVCAKGAGTKVQLARVIGIAASWAPQSTEHKGEILESIRFTALSGTVFEATIFETGEVLQAVDLFLPSMFAKQVKAALEAVSDDPAATALLDVTIGVEATGKTPPYRWLVTTFIPPKHAAMMDQLRNRRPALPHVPGQAYLTLEGSSGHTAGHAD